MIRKPKDDTTFKNSEWHILETIKGWRVFSRGFRCYGTFNSIDNAYDHIIENFPKKRGNIFVQNKNGVIIKELFFPLKILDSPIL